jgi:protein gp37
MSTLVVKPLTEAAARLLTDEIRRDIEALWARLLAAYEGGAHVALGYGQWGTYFENEFRQSASRGYQFLDSARVVRAIESHSTMVERPNERQARAIAETTKEPAEQAAIWEEVVTETNGAPTAAAVKEVAARRPAARPTFNRVNENIDWAWWSWNPVTGCLHNCPYCYARDIANRFYPQKFEPTFLPERLSAPANTTLPRSDDPRSRNVFVCSMADLFGKWVPQEWIDAVFREVKSAPEWRFLFLTKFPQRLAELEWPDNAWVGTSVDRQHRVQVAEKAFRGVKAGLKWLSCEPLLEPLRFGSLEMFDWVVIGAQTRSSGAPEFQPPLAWIADLVAQARAADCRVYIKPNVVLPQEVPWS